MIKIIIKYIMNHYQQISKFVLIGILSFLINFYFFHLFFGILKLNYQIATSLAYIITILSHFTLHRIYTFKVKNQFLAGNAIRYISMLGLNFIITLSTMWIVVNILKISPYFGLIASVSITAFSSFFIMKYFVFRSRMTHLSLNV